MQATRMRALTELSQKANSGTVCYTYVGFLSKVYVSELMKLRVKMEFNC